MTKTHTCLKTLCLYRSGQFSLSLVYLDMHLNSDAVVTLLFLKTFFKQMIPPSCRSDEGLINAISKLENHYLLLRSECAVLRSTAVGDHGTNVDSSVGGGHGEVVSIRNTHNRGGDVGKDLSSNLSRSTNLNVVAGNGAGRSPRNGALHFLETFVVCLS